MPITEYRPSFLYEAWALYGIGTAVVLIRFAVRFRTVGWRNFQGDDFFSALVLIFYAMDAFTVHLIYYMGTNVEAAAIQKTKTLSPHDMHDFSMGSKLELTAWYSYTALIWSLKGTMLCFFSRMTIGTWHNLFVKTASGVAVVGYIAVFLTITFGCFPYHQNWQVVPDPGEKCTFKRQNFLVTTVFNVLTDTLILGIPVPLLWKLQMPLRKKIIVGLLLSSGAFVIAAALIRIVLTLSSEPSALTINEWGVRETIVGIVTVNMPILRPVFSRAFWTGGPLGSRGSTATFRSATGGTTTAATVATRGGGGGGKGGGDKHASVSGPYELERQRASASTPASASSTCESHGGGGVHDSQESIMGKREGVARGAHNAVVVRTTYGITREDSRDDLDDDDDDAWLVGRGGGATGRGGRGGGGGGRAGNEASVHAGAGDLV